MKKQMNVHLAAPAESADPRFARFEPAPQRVLYPELVYGQRYSAFDALYEVSRKLDQSIAAFDKAQSGINPKS